MIFRANFKGKEDLYTVELKNHKYMRTLLLSLLVLGALGVKGQAVWPHVTQQSKPWTRWWWMGSAVNKVDLTRNMEAYSAAGLGGLELTPIYGVKGYEDQFLSYLSPAWVDMFRHTLAEGRRLHLGIDMSTGTGWPFGGGPLIDSVYACKELFSKTWTVAPGSKLTDSVVFWQEPLVHTDGRPVKIEQLKEPVFSNPDLQAMALFQVRFARRLPLQALMGYSSTGQTVDLTAKVDGLGRLDWVAPVSGGSWTLYGLFQGWHGKMVERAAPGGEGNVIDHFSETALRKYLSRIDSAFAGVDLSGLRCFFNDSYEVDDARGQSDWTPGFLAVFRQRRGYDLRDHLPALFGNDSADANGRVRCDFRETISELLLEQFTQPWAQWAASKGARIRNQAHGSPANILDLYSASDIPETEGTDVFRNKFATSAAHVTGKPLVSSESGTWLGEHFLSSMSDVKRALDGFFTSGVNHVFYHGTAYTPFNDPWPGWLFYASVHFTPNDPSWANFFVLNRYVARVQSFLQEGKPDNDVLLYLPMYDSWMEPGKALLKHYDRMDPEWSGTAFKKSAEWMWRNGYAFDYVSDRQLEAAEPEGIRIKISGGTHYHTVLVPGVSYISLKAMEKLVQLARGGASILFVKSLPKGVPGYGDLSGRQTAFDRLTADLHWDSIGLWTKHAAVGAGQFLVSDDLGALLVNANVRREGLPIDSLDFVRRRYGAGHVYFIVNHSSKTWSGYRQLETLFHSAAIFDPMTGEAGLARTRNGAVYFQLLPGQSCIIQTSDSILKGPLFPYYQPAGAPVVLSGPWTIRFLSGGPVLPAGGKLAELGPWTKLEGQDVRRFSGTADYRISFARPTGSAKTWLLNLGKVDETAKVLLNGKELGSLIGPDFQLAVASELLRAQNTLEVIVSSNMVNRIEDMDRRGEVYKKFYNYNFPAHDKADKGADGLFSAAKWAPVDAGLSGPVKLIPLEPIR